MKEKYDLKKLFVLNSMHDQRITSIELKTNELIFHYSELCYDESLKDKNLNNKHTAFQKCNITFKDVKDADVVAEIRKKKETKVEGTRYYDEEFLNFIIGNQYSIETIQFFYGYETVIILAMLVDKKGYYCEECTIKISAKEIVYEWE